MVEDGSVVLLADSIEVRLPHFHFVPTGMLIFSPTRAVAGMVGMSRSRFLVLLGL